MNMNNDNDNQQQPQPQPQQPEALQQQQQAAQFLQQQLQVLFPPPQPPQQQQQPDINNVILDLQQFLQELVLASSRIPLEDPRTMELGLGEILLAWYIKQDVESASHVSNLSDLEYVQYALTVDREQPQYLERVLQRIEVMQAFRQEYQIDDTVEQGVEAFHRCTQQHPGMFLSVQYLESSGSCVAINDLKEYYPAKICETEKSRRNFFVTLYYRFQSMSPTFQAMRHGMASIFECEGVGLQNYDSKLQERMIHELLVPYPKLHRETAFLNSPGIINMAYGFWKRYMNPNMKQRFQLGYQVRGLDGHRIDEFYKIPTLEEAQRAMVERVKLYLQVRYHHQATFCLPTLQELQQRLVPPSTPPPPTTRTESDNNDNDDNDDGNDME